MNQIRYEGVPDSDAISREAVISELRRCLSYICEDSANDADMSEFDCGRVQGIKEAIAIVQHIVTER